MIDLAGERLAGVLGHELRNPLAAAAMGTSLLAAMVDAGDPRRAVVDAVQRDLDRLARLIDSYLDLARAAEPKRTPVDVAALLVEVAARRPQVVLRDRRDGACVRGDAGLLERAIENLVENAVQAGARTVWIDTDVARRRFVIRVDDDGPGVPDVAVANIFAPGFSRSGGTGLGLAIVAATMRAHGGSVRCEPRTSGARFVLELPLLAGVAAACA